MDVSSFILFEKCWKAILFDCDYDVKFLGLNNIPTFYTDTWAEVREQISDNESRIRNTVILWNNKRIFANEAAEPRGSAVELAHHSAVREYTGNISSQRKGPFLTIFGCK